MSSSLYEKIYRAVDRIPSGQVASYSQVAAAVGMPRGAQVVGWALRALPLETAVPWQRVINQKRRLSIVNPKFTKTLQRQRLEEEGLSVEERDGWYVVTGDRWYIYS